MPDALAGRRVLEFFGLLAIAPAEAKKQEKERSPLAAPLKKKAVVVEQPRKNM